LREFVLWFPRVRPEWRFRVFVLPPRARQFDDPPTGGQVQIEYVPLGDSDLGRLRWLHRELPRRLEAIRAAGLLSFANVGLAKRVVPQVVYLHQALAFQSASPRKLGVFAALRMSLPRRLVLRGAGSSAFVIVQTEDMRRRVETAAPSLAGRVRVIPGCVGNPPPTSAPREEKVKLIESAGWPRLLYVAHPLKHKNHPALIRALPKIVERYPHATLLLTMEPEGRTTGGDTGYLQKVHRLAKQAGVKDSVVWLGTLSQQEVQYGLRRATVAVFPSFDESFGLPLAEAITAGCPLAASDLPSAREVAGAAAVYFDPVSPVSIAETVTDLIARPEAMDRLKREATERKDFFEPANVAERIAATIEEAVGA